MKSLKCFTILLALLVSTLAYSRNKTKAADSLRIFAQERAVLDAYIDSVAFYKHQIDSLQQLRNERTDRMTEYDTRYMRLFTPLSFYGDLARRHFSLSVEDSLTTDYRSLVDNALLNIYLYHPELVREYWRKPKATVVDEKKVETIEKKEVNFGHYEIPKAEEIDVEPIELVIRKPNFWTISGEYYLQIMQNYYSDNWYQGGESNYAALGRITICANYNNKQKVKWENKLEMNLGFQTSKSDSIHSVKTSSDLLRYTGKFGLQASKKWYYTIQAVASSQFMRSFASNSHSVNSDFLSPLNVNVSLGMDYNIKWLKDRLTGSVHLAPVAFNYRYVDRLNLAPRNGIEEGKHSMFDFGSTFTLDVNWKISNNVNWKSRLYGYTTYKRMELQWENTFNLKISRFISANVYFYPRFDDSNASRKDKDYGYFQLKEYTSLGLAYSF